jgi:hypothetical protein
MLVVSNPHLKKKYLLHKLIYGELDKFLNKLICIWVIFIEITYTLT